MAISVSSLQNLLSGLTEQQSYRESALPESKDIYSQLISGTKNDLLTLAKYLMKGKLLDSNG